MSGNCILNHNRFGGYRYVSDSGYFNLSGAGATQGVVPNGILVGIDDAVNGLFHLLELGSGEMCFKDAILDAGTEPFEDFCKLIAPPVVWNIVRDDVEHRIDLPCFFRFRFVQLDLQFTYTGLMLG